MCVPGQSTLHFLGIALPSVKMSSKYFNTLLLLLFLDNLVMFIFVAAGPHQCSLPLGILALPNN